MTNRMFKTLSVLILIISVTAFTNFLKAQDKMMLSARKYYAQKSYAKVIKLAEKALDNDKKQAEWWYLKAASEYELYQFPKYQDKKYGYDKECVKSAIKARQYDENREVYPDYESVMKKIAEKNNKEAIANFASNRFSKAIQMYKSSFELTGDTIALGMLGMSYWGEGMEMDGLRVLRQVTRWNYGAKQAGWGESTYLREPFEILSNYFIAQKEKDSALFYNEMGLSIYFMNRTLLENEKTLLREMLINKARMGLDQSYIDVVNKGLGYFPADTFFLIQQNYYYLTQIENATQTRPYDSADGKLWNFFLAKSAQVKAGVVNEADEFLIGDSTQFVFQCLDYYLRTNTRRAAPFCFKKWYLMYNKKPEFDEKLAESLLKNPPDKISRRMVGMLYEEAIADFPLNKNFKNYRLAYFKNWANKPHRRSELSNLIEMNDAVIANFPKDATLKTFLEMHLVQACDSAAMDGKMYDAWRYYYRLTTDYPKNKQATELQKKLAMRDFEERYAGTRIDYTTVKSKKTANTGWDGNSSLCRPGRVPDSTLRKVLHRVNYFRQNAGIVYPMNINYEKSRKCQEAAVMYAPVGVFTREPKPETHQCYTDAAREAAAISQAILESNPAQCVTIFMSDSKSEEVVNRMSILNPSSLELGVGMAENNCVFWLLDMNDAPDSNYYKNHFVSWPPAGYSPSMLFFKRWNFSMAANLNDAIITIKDKNANDVIFGATVQKLPGMVLQNLVIDTHLDPKKANKTDYYDVIVELKDKRKISYRISLF